MSRGPKGKNSLIPFDVRGCVERNKSVAKELYGDKLDKNRRVVGTDIWFDDCWRIHKGELKGGYI